MNATDENEKIARQIINLLANEKVTIDDASRILIFVNHQINANTTVQHVTEKLFNCEK